MKFTNILLSLLPLVSAQQFAGDVIQNSLPSVPGAEITFFRVADPAGKNNNLTLINYSSLSNSQRLDPSKIQRVVIIVHGLDRDPGTYMSNMLSALAATTPGNPQVDFSNVQIVCPYFPNGDDKGTGYPWTTGLKPGRGSTSNALVWPGSQWSAGGNTQYPYGSTPISSYNALDQLVHYFDNRSLYPNVKQIVVGGHSLGGQFVNRYTEIGIPLATTSPVTYWIANPNSWAWMSTSRPLDTSTCPSYDNWREGFTNFTQYPMTYQTSLVANGRSAVLANWNSKSKAFVRGTQDLGDDSSSCAPFTTGINRNERFFNFIKAFPPVCTNPIHGQCDTVDYVNIGHDAGAIMASPAGQARLFLDNWTGNGSRAYDFGYPRLAAHDDPFPDPSMNGSFTGNNHNVYAGNMTYAGCWSDNVNGIHTLSVVGYENATNTIESCTAYCANAGYSIAGLEYSTQCFCGNSLAAHAGQTVDNGCTMPCSGNSSEICGDSNRLSLFSNGKPAQVAIAGTPEVVGNYTSLYCYTEATNGRALTGNTYSDPAMTLESCAAFCNGYEYFGAEYSTQCFCGSSFNGGAAIAAAGDCSMPCGGNAAELCGGPSRLTVYQLSPGANVSPISQPPAPATSTSTAATTSTAGAGAIPSASLCPSTNGQSISYANSSLYTITCSSDSSNGAYTGVGATNSYLDCLTQCDAAASAGCQGFVYVGLAGGLGAGTCWLKTTMGSDTPAGANLIAGAKNTGSSASMTATSTITSLPSPTGTTAVVATTATTATTATAQSIPSASLCPSANGQAVSYANSSAYTVTCSSDSTQGSYTGVNAANSYLDCMALCDAAASTGCQGFVYVGQQGGLGGGACWLKTTMGAYTPAANNFVAGFKGVSTSSTAVAAPTTTSTSAGASSNTGNAVTPTASISCPVSNSTIYTALNGGGKFLIECGIDHAAGDMGSTNANTFADCVESCAKTQGCVDVSLSGTACYMKSSVGAPVYNNIWGARLITTTASSTAASTISSAATSSSGGAPTIAAFVSPPETSSTAAITTSSATSTPSPTTMLTSTSSTSTSSTTPTGPSGISAVGCMVDTTNARSLPVQVYSNSTNTPQQCALACRALGYKYAGTEYSSECWCGNSLPSTAASASDCSMTCAGDQTQLCGGPSRLSVTVDSTWKQTFFVANTYQTWSLMSCYTDGSARTLGTGVGVVGGSNNMTSANCLSACASGGFKYCGTEYYMECWGSNTLPDARLALSGDPLSQGCSYPCTGNSTEACGGANRILVYVNNGTASK